MHENREKFAAPESRRARSIHDQTGMRPAEHLAVMQRARTCGSSERLVPLSLRTMMTAMQHSPTELPRITVLCHPPDRRPLARPAPMATMRGERKGGGTGWPSVLPSAATSRHQKGRRQRRHTHARARPPLPLPLNAITLLPCPLGSHPASERAPTSQVGKDGSDPILM